MFNCLGGSRGKSAHHRGSPIFTTFQHYDKDKSGAIESAELEKLMKDLGLDVTPPKLRAAMRSLDKDRSGKVEFEEFYAWYKRNKQLQEARNIFDKYDTDKSRTLDGGELKKLLTDLKCGVSITEALTAMDTGRTGKIEFDAFLKWHTKRGRREVHMVFKTYDKDGSGSIDKNELAQLLEDLNEESTAEAVEDVFKKLKGKGSKVSEASFMKWFQNQASAREALDVFVQYDEDDSGSIEVQELENLLKDLRIHRPANEVIAEVDTGDGKLQLDEFSRWYSKHRDLDDARQAFNRYDSDKSGFLSHGEFIYVIIDMGLPTDDPSITEVFQQLDRDNNGRISFDEFAKWNPYA